jgi:hypothetical protein
MDDLAGCLGGSVFGLVFLLAFGVVILAGWLVYKLVEWVLVPFGAWLWRESVHGADEFRAWYHEVTWRRRMERTHREAIAAIDATRQEHMALAEATVASLAQQQYVLTADRTTAVRPAVAVE